MASARFTSLRDTVKVMSVMPSRLAFWTIMSTSTPFSASGTKIAAEMPGLSGMPHKVTRAWSLSYAMPETSTDSIMSSSCVTSVPGSLLNVERTRTGTLYFLANSTERICSTFAPMEDISSISS